jgi:hypothetical protein
MFLMGLNPAYTPMVYAQNPNDLAATVNAARNIEIGYNFATGKTPRDISVTPFTSTFTPSKPAPVVSTEIDELTKKLEQLTINYANLSSAMLAQLPAPRRRNGPNKTTSRPQNIGPNANVYRSQNAGPNDFTCYNCNAPGHIARNCTQPRRYRQDNRRPVSAKLEKCI